MESAEVRADPGSRTLRVAALTTGTLGLLAVGVLAIMVTPGRGDSPLAVESSPSFVDPELLVPLTTALLDRAAAELTGAFGVTRADSDSATVATFASVTTAVSTSAGDPTAPLTTPLATLLESGFALVTLKSLAGYSAGDPLAVRLASGGTFDAEVLATVGHAALVALGALIGDEPGHEVAHQLPADDAMVTVLATPPQSVRLAELASTTAPEGTAVVDSAGRLIGLCTRDAAGRTSLAPTIDAATPDPQPTAPASNATTTTPSTATTSSLPGATATSTSLPNTSTTSTTATSTTATSTTTVSTSTSSTLPPPSTTVAPGQR